MDVGTQCDKMLSENFILRYMIDKKELWQEKMCKEASEKYTFPIHCTVLVEDLAGGWGYPKITAVLNAPSRNLLWFDCDVMVTGTVDHLFENEDFQNTGSVWYFLITLLKLIFFCTPVLFSPASQTIRILIHLKHV